MASGRRRRNGHRITNLVEVPSFLVQVPVVLLELLPQVVQVRVRPREPIEDVLRILRDEHDYQQLMEIAGVDYPSREERFEVVYMLLSLTQNSRIMVKCTASENTPVPTVTTLWPNAGWLEREVFDMYGVLFDGNTDLRRKLTFFWDTLYVDFPIGKSYGVA